MRVLFVTLLLLATYQPSQTPKKSSVDKGLTQAKTGEAQKSPSPSISIGECVNCFSVQTPHTQTEQKDPYDARTDSLYRNYLLFTIIGVCGGLFGIAVLIAQTMATHKAADAAKTSAEVAARTVEALRHIERPWILITIKDGLGAGIDAGTEAIIVPKIPAAKPELTNVFSYSWFVTNEGKTPALICEVAARFEIANANRLTQLKENPPEYGEGVTFTDNSIIIAPGRVHEWTEESVAWTQQDRMNIEQRKALLIAYGIVKYRDAIDEDPIHESRFCAIYRFYDVVNFMNGSFEHFADFGELTKHT